MKRITSRAELTALARELGVHSSWYAPVEQNLTATVEGDVLDNAGRWPRRHCIDKTLELYVTLWRTTWEDDAPRLAEPLACLNLATLLSWAAEERGGRRCSWRLDEDERCIMWHGHPPRFHVVASGDRYHRDGSRFNEGS